MDFVSGMMFGVGVTGMGFILLIGGALNRLSRRMELLEATIRRCSEGDYEDLDWWERFAEDGGRDDRSWSTS